MAPRTIVARGVCAAVILWIISIFGFGALQIPIAFAAVAVVTLVVVHISWASTSISMQITMLRALQTDCALVAITGVGLGILRGMPAACSLTVSAVIVAASARRMESLALSNPTADNGQTEGDDEIEPRRHGTGGP